MEKIDYSQFREVSINDLPIKFVVSNTIEKYPKILEEHGITNLEQLFNAYDRGLFNDGRKTGYKALKGMVEILKNVYLGEPLVADSYLEVKPNSFDGWAFDNEFNNKIKRLGLTIMEIIILEDYYAKKMFTKEDDFSNLNLMDIMNSFVNDKDYQTLIISEAITFVDRVNERHGYKPDRNEPLGSYTTNRVKELQNLIFKISVLSNYYKKNKENTQSQDEVLVSLKKELESLFSMKKGLDYQIQLLEGQIESLNGSKGIKR